MIDKANALGGLGITKDAARPGLSGDERHVVRSGAVRELAQHEHGKHAGVQVRRRAATSNCGSQRDPGYDPTNLYRNSLAKYFLPSLNEWHKAAYYDRRPACTTTIRPAATACRTGLISWAIRTSMLSSRWRRE